MLRDCLAADALAEEVLEEACPGLVEGLDPWAGHLPYAPEALSLTELEGLERHLAGYATGPGKRPESLALDRVLAGYARAAEEQPPSWWDRFLAWLKALLGREEDEESSSLADWLSELSLPERLARLVFYVATAAIIVLALAIVASELAKSGLLRRRPGNGARQPGEVPAEGRPAAEANLADIEAAPDRAKPSLLLRLVLGVLARRGRLPDSRALTHRELRASVALDASQSAWFGQVVSTAERSTYGAQPIDAAELAALLSAGRRLLASLEATA